MVRNENHIIHVMLFYIQHQLVQHGTSTDKYKYDLSPFGSLSARFESFYKSNQLFDVVVQTNIAGVHDDELALGVANDQHLLRVKVLNVVDVLGMFHPFAPDAQQIAQNRRLRYGKHIIHLSNLEGRPYRSKEIGDNILHTVLLIGLAELRYSYPYEHIFKDSFSHFFYSH